MNPTSDKDKENITTPMILKTLGLLAAFFLLVQLSAFFLLVLFQRERPRHPSPNPSQSKPNAPLLESTFSENLQKLRKEEKMILNTYGWSDRDNDVARIPIDEAMDRLLQSHELEKPPEPKNQEQP